MSRRVGEGWAYLEGESSMAFIWTWINSLPNRRHWRSVFLLVACAKTCAQTGDGPFTCINIHPLSPGSWTLSGWLEQGCGSRWNTHTGWVYPALPTAASGGLLLGGDGTPQPWSPGLPAHPLQPTRQPRHVHCSLPCLCGGPSSGCCCCSLCNRWVGSC